MKALHPKPIHRTPLLRKKEAEENAAADDAMNDTYLGTTNACGKISHMMEHFGRHVEIGAIYFFLSLPLLLSSLPSAGSSAVLCHV